VALVAAAAVLEPGPLVSALADFPSESIISNGPSRCIPSRTAIGPSPTTSLSPHAPLPPTRNRSQRDEA
jgi:hypothetical protein